MERLDAIFNPDSIAIIGASRSRGKVGNEILRNLIYGGYKGAIYPINPEAERVLGLEAYPSVASVPGDIDLAIVAIPAESVPEVVRECVEKGVKGLVITTSGFGEVGRGDLEDEVKALIEGRGTRIIGPNTVGLVNTQKDLNASFFPATPLKGGIAFITQSGALGGALVDWTRKEGLGMSKIVSVGNKCDVDDTDLLEYFEQDGDTDVIAMYIESLKEGRKFMEVAKRVSRKKPIVALKAGKSEAGGRAVYSHTGAMAGSYEVYRTALRQSGVVITEGPEELFNFAMALNWQHPSRGDRIGIVTNGGGAGIMAADACVEYGLQVPKFDEKTIERMRSFLPPLASPYNPVDIMGDAGYERYKGTLEETLENEAIDGVIVIYVHVALTDSMEPARALTKVVEEQRCIKPVIGCWIGGYGIEDAVAVLKANKIPNYTTPKRAAGAMKALVEYGRVYGRE